MLGNFQKSQLRIEVQACADAIKESLLYPEKLQKWMLSGKLSSGMPSELHSGLVFDTKIGGISIHHRVDIAADNCLRLLLSQGIDGFHEWYWGEGWVQSHIEGVSILPLSLGHTANLMSLQYFLSRIKGS
ncbi:MAG: hypothetical protein AAF378_07310 [Cyanobacteria bacterium P01_A01_bin.84]